MAEMINNEMTEAHEELDVLAIKLDAEGNPLPIEDSEFTQDTVDVSNTVH